MHGTVHLGNNYACDIVGLGSVQFSFADGMTFVLHNVRHVPQLKKSLISTGQLDDAGYHTTFGDKKWKICKGSRIVAKGCKVDTLYPLYVSSVRDHVVAVTEQPSVSLWHGRLGHMSKRGMETLSRCGYLPYLRYADFSHCEHCIYGKHTQTPHKRSLSLKSDRLDLVHSDVCEMPQLSLGGKKYFVSFIDDATRKVWVYPIRAKSDVLDTFKKFLAFENQTGKKLKSCARIMVESMYQKHSLTFVLLKALKVSLLLLLILPRMELQRG